jgi:hypothetical protein
MNPLYQKQTIREPSDDHLGLCSPGSEFCLISRTAQYGPVCCVVWEGRSVRGVPIPISFYITFLDNF